MENVVLYETPELKSPCLVAGFRGWPNAGEVSTRTLGYLREKLAAKKFGELTAESFYDFTSLEPVTRPVTVIEDGLVKEQSFPSNEFFYWKNQQSAHDLILLLGVEPQLRWNEYADAVLGLAERLGVKKMFTLGGTYDRVPHTREPRISAVVNAPELKQGLKAYGIGLTEYRGPSSVHTLLLLASRGRNIDSVSLWGHAPDYRPYVYIPVNPRVCHRLLQILAGMTGIDIDLEDMERAGGYLDEQINEAVGQSPELQEYVRKLEEEYEVAEHREPEGGGTIIEEVEEFLKGGESDSGQEV